MSLGPNQWTRLGDKAGEIGDGDVTGHERVKASLSMSCRSCCARCMQEAGRGDGHAERQIDVRLHVPCT
jgi:hypothetical protein